MEFGEVVSKNGPCLDTVRALHQTVVALRAALEQSRSEILELKSKSWPVEDVQDTLKTLSIENHILRRTIISEGTEEKQKVEKESSCLKTIEQAPVKTEESDKTKDKDINLEASYIKTIKQGIEETEGSDNLKQSDIDKNIVSETKETDTKNVGNKENTVSQSNKELLQPKEIESCQLLEEITVGEELNRNETISQQSKKQVKIVSPKSSDKHSLKAKIFIKTETFSARKISKSLESLTIISTPVSPESSRKLTVSKTVSFSHIDYKGDFQFEKVPAMGDKQSETNRKTPEPAERQKEETKAPDKYVTKAPDKFEPKPPDKYKEEPMQSPHDDDDQDQEVDDIELIFTTDEMKETDLKEHLVSIDAGESTGESSHLLRCPISDLDQLDISDRELDDDVFNDNYDGDMLDPSDYASSGYKKGASLMYNSKSDNSINNEEKSLKSCCSYQDSSFENKSLEKDESFDRFEEKVRIVETDISKCGITDVEYSSIRRNTCPNPLQYRPLLHREAMSKGLNARKSRPILVHSNSIRRDSGAQTDISALPDSAWRSESSLANKARIGEHFTTLPSKFPLPGSRIRLSEKTVEARRVLLSDIGFTSMVPELSRSADHLFPVNLRQPSVTGYGQFLKTPDLYSPGYALNTSQRFTWTATTATPSDGSHSRYSSLYPLSPPAPSRRCSAPVSPSRRVTMKSTPSRVRFANGSLPELRGDWTLTVDSGDSTDSLVEEAENYLRRSIDCIVSGRDIINYNECKKSVPRRASAPEPSGDNVPPQGWQPFLPRVPRDLKLDHWVKVITPEGRVRGGRVRYIGPIASQSDQFVGVQLSSPDGPTDGTFGTRRYFQCEPYHGIFVPFKKVIMGWRP